MENETTRAGRLGVVMNPQLMDRRFTNEETLWAETDRMRAERLERAICRDKLLDWVRERLEALSVPQRRSIEMHYFEGLTLEQIAQRLGRDKSTISRAEKRALRELRAMKQQDTTWTIYCEVYRFGVVRKIR